MQRRGWQFSAALLPSRQQLAAGQHRRIQEASFRYCRLPFAGELPSGTGAVENNCNVDNQRKLGRQTTPVLLSGRPQSEYLPELRLQSVGREQKTKLNVYEVNVVDPAVAARPRTLRI